MIIALTGASGSIGRELIPFLSSLGFKVITISSSSPPNGKSVFSYDDLKKNNIHFKVHFVIHLASNNSNLDVSKISNELQLTKTILKAMPNLQCNNLIFFSTAKVYGDNGEKQHVFNEQSPLNPCCAYSKAKKLCEEHVITQSDKESYSSVILRLPPVLNQSKSSNIGKLISFAQKGIPLISLSQGASNKRSFISMNNIQSIIDAVRKFPIDTRKKVMFEYLVIKDKNDDIKSADKLVTLLNGIDAKVNLIFFNPFPGTIYERPSKNSMVKFNTI